MQLIKIITIITLLGSLISPVYADPYEENSTMPELENATYTIVYDPYPLLLIRPLFMSFEVVEETPKPLNEQVVDVAKQYLGVPYVWGGTTPNGFDCSGLVQYCYKQVGVEISRTTFTQIKDGISVPTDQIQVGDLVFFGSSSSPHHVGIYIGEGQFIHAPHTGDVVKISFLADRSNYSAARRIVITE